MNPVAETKSYWIVSLLSLVVFFVMLATGDIFIRENGVIVNAIGWVAFPLLGFAVSVNMGLLQIAVISSGRTRAIAATALVVFVLGLKLFGGFIGNCLLDLANALF